MAFVKLPELSIINTKGKRDKIILITCDIIAETQPTYKIGRYPQLNNQEKSSLSQAASAAHTIHGAIKTGKAISAAAKGVAVGGPYGAAAGLALGAGQHAGKLLAAAAVLLMLPVLFVLMLPSLIFGGLTSSGSSSQPILNDNAAIVQNMSDIAFAVNQVLGEGITDAEARIAQDFAATGGDNYEIINPYAADMTSNANSFIAQYCAARGEEWDAISLTDMQTILRRGKGSLYSYTRTSETRTVEDDDPETEDVVETKEETWYIYTLSYNGEGYFADHVFHLTDAQKSLANNYASNLSLFLNDGLFQYTEYSGTMIASLGDVRFTDGATESRLFQPVGRTLGPYALRHRQHRRLRLRAHLHVHCGVLPD